MQGNMSGVMSLKSSGSPLEINTTTQKYSEDGKPNVLYVERCITYSVGKRFLSFNITEACKGDTVNLVNIDIAEESGKGSCANLILRFIRNDRYGIVCSMYNKLSGSYELVKQNYCVPPLPDAELGYYYCRETGDGSCFTLEKVMKKLVNYSDVVERVKATHAFVVGHETLSVKVKITNDMRVGLRVEVEGPVKLTTDYSKHVFKKIEDRMENEIQANVLTLFTNATDSDDKGGRKRPSQNRRRSEISK